MELSNLSALVRFELCTIVVCSASLDCVSHKGRICSFVKMRQSQAFSRTFTCLAEFKLPPTPSTKYAPVLPKVDSQLQFSHIFLHQRDKLRNVPIPNGARNFHQTVDGHLGEMLNKRIVHLKSSLFQRAMLDNNVDNSWPKMITTLDQAPSQLFNHQTRLKIEHFVNLATTVDPSKVPQQILKSVLASPRAVTLGEFYEKHVSAKESSEIASAQETIRFEVGNVALRLRDTLDEAVGLTLLTKFVTLFPRFLLTPKCPEDAQNALDKQVADLMKDVLSVIDFRCSEFVDRLAGNNGVSAPSAREAKQFEMNLKSLGFAMNFFGDDWQEKMVNRRDDLTYLPTVSKVALQLTV